MNKEQLLREIEQIPKFVLRDVAIKQQDKGLVAGTEFNWTEDYNHKAVTEEDNYNPLAFVSNNYQLVQFESVFKPLIENIERLEGAVIYYGGVGAMTVFPEDEKLLVNGGDKIGIIGWNSVNKTSSVIIKFCVRHKDTYITMPKLIAGFKRMHVGKAIQITQNFLVVVDKVREVWKQILTEFKEEMDLWDVFMKMIAVIEDRNYKSDIHRRKRLDKISADIFKWAVAGRLINA